VVMITKDQLFVQGELVASIADIKAANTALVEPLREKLKAPRIIGDIGEKDLANREITVMADKSLPYEILKKVMATCTDADYGKISLAVLQKEKPVPPGFKPA
jgi:biopolymer transport protein TolR